MKNVIPPQTIPSDSRIGNVSVGKNEHLVFSFRLLENNAYFGLSGTCDRWSVELFEMLKNISQVPINDLLSGKYRTYRFHSHDNAKPPCKLPNGVSLKDSFQIRISKSKGGIHGVLADGVFYVFWLDPLRNMYPDEHHGGARKIKPLSTCCLDLREEIDGLSAKNKELTDENDVLKQLLNMQ